MLTPRATPRQSVSGTVVLIFAHGWPPGPGPGKRGRRPAQGV